MAQGGKDGDTVIIQRAGDPGFGYGNFRALFESIERAQKAAAAQA